jgi:hypothetical protein
MASVTTPIVTPGLFPSSSPKRCHICPDWHVSPAGRGGIPDELHESLIVHVQEDAGLGLRSISHMLKNDKGP